MTRGTLLTIWTKIRAGARWLLIGLLLICIAGLQSLGGISPYPLPNLSNLIASSSTSSDGSEELAHESQSEESDEGEIKTGIQFTEELLHSWSHHAPPFLIIFQRVLLSDQHLDGIPRIQLHRPPKTSFSA